MCPYDRKQSWTGILSYWHLLNVTDSLTWTNRMTVQQADVLGWPLGLSTLEANATGSSLSLCLINCMLLACVG
jgi:hypothetical protein